MFAKGRSNQLAFIEEYYQVILETISSISKHIDAQKSNERKELLNQAKDIANGDKEIELSIIYTQNNYYNFSMIYDSLFESIYLSIYSFYEKTLKNIAINEGINIDKVKVNYIEKYVELIKQHVNVVNFNIEIENYISDINVKHRKNRNSIVHNENDISIISIEIIYELLEKTIKVLVEINSLIVNKKY